MSDPTLQEQIRYYDAWNANHRDGDFGEIEPEIRARATRILLHLEELGTKDASILEIGCGTGWMTGELSRFGRVTAIDLSPRAIEIARGRYPDVEFEAGDFLTADFGDRGFDVVVCVETLFYVSDQAMFMHKMSSLLKPGGTVFMTTINKYVYERRSDIGAPAEGQVRHWLPRREVTGLLARHFDVTQVESLEPAGDQGALRFVNSYKVNALFSRLLSAPRWKRMKEQAGLGGGLVFTARRR